MPSYTLELIVKAIDQAIATIQGETDAIENLGAVGNTTAARLKDLTANSDIAWKSMMDGQRAAGMTSEELGSLAESLGIASAQEVQNKIQMDSLVQSWKDGKISSGELAAGMKEVEQAAQSSTGPLTEMWNGLMDVKTELLGAGAVIGAFVGAAKGLYDLGLVGIEAMRAERGLAAMLGSAELATYAIEDLAAATGGEISNVELAQLATRALTSGFADTKDEAVRLIATAEALGDVFGMEAPEMFNRLTTAMMTGSSRALRGLGLDADDVKARMEELAGTQGDLTDMQIASIAVMEEADELIKKTADLNLDQLDATDRLKTSWANFRQELGERVAPTMLTVIDAMNLILTWGGKIETAVKQHGEEVLTTTENYAAYAAELLRAAGAAGYVVDAHGDMVQSYTVLDEYSGEVIYHTEKLIQENYLLGESAFYAADGLDKYAAASWGSEDAARMEADAIREAASAAGDMQSIAVETATSMEILALAMAGPVARENESYADDQARIRDRIAEVRLELEELTRGKPPTMDTTEYKEKVGELRSELGTLQGSLGDLEAAHQLAMNQIVFDLLAAQIATKDWGDTGVQLQIDLARSMGLIDEQTWAMASSINESMASVDSAPTVAELSAIAGAAINASGKVSNIAREILGLPDEKHVRIYIETHYTSEGGPGQGGYRGPEGEYQHGTPAAAPGWAWVGEVGPEMVRFGGGERVIPAGLGGPGGGEGRGMVVLAPIIVQDSAIRDATGALNYELLAELIPQ